MTTLSEDVSLGEAIRERRHQLGLTLVDVAMRADLSHPFLSQLERGLARPSMRSLTAIAAALNTTAQALLAEAETDAGLDRVSLVRRDATAATVDSPGGTVRALVRGERPMLPVEYTGAPKTFHEYFTHPGDEFVYVVRGRIEADIEGELYVVGPGECLYFMGGLRHRWRSISRAEVQLVVVQHNR